MEYFTEFRLSPKQQGYLSRMMGGEIVSGPSGDIHLGLLDGATVFGGSRKFALGMIQIQLVGDQLEGRLRNIPNGMGIESRHPLYSFYVK